MAIQSPPIRASRFLEQVLLWNFLIHLVALLTMLTMVMPGLAGLPGGTALEIAARRAYVAGHHIFWRIGWLPWHLSAAVDLVTGVALIFTRWIPRIPALLTLIVTAVAVGVEQSREIPWALWGPVLAHGEPAVYAGFEAAYFRAICLWGASLYLLMALGWTWCFAAAGTWSRALTWISALAWGALAVGSAALLLPEPWRPSPQVAAAANGIGFPLLLVWLVLVTEQVLRRARPDAAHGRLAPWRHPWGGPVGRLLDLLAASRFIRALCEWAPSVGFRSDITDVIYCNYLVDAGRLEALTPPGLRLQRIGPDGRCALFTFLTYRHGHFGPALLGPLRRLMPSPIHTNWRIYVTDPQTGKDGIYFVTNAIAATPHALAARLLSEGMPMHVMRRAALAVQKDGACTLSLDPGKGTAPDVEANLRPAAPALPPPWGECFADYRAFLAYCVPQDRALSVQPWYDRVTRQEIQLCIPLEICEPMEGEVRSAAARAIVGDAAALCFRVPHVAFRFDGEQYDRRRPQ